MYGTESQFKLRKDGTPLDENKDIVTNLIKNHYLFLLN